MKSNKKSFWQGFGSVGLYPSTLSNINVTLRISLRDRTAMEALAHDFAKVGGDIVQATKRFDEDSITDSAPEKPIKFRN